VVYALLSPIRADRWCRAGRRLVVLAALCGCAENAVTAPSRGVAPVPVVTPERLGNVFTQPSPYARNVWDMQLFGGRIWVGHGDSIDNWGPIPLWWIDPATGALAQEGVADEEQVDVFRVLGGELYVPGHDSRGDWSAGEFYRLEAGKWVQHRTLPHAVHVFDLSLHGGRLFAALGTEDVAGEEALLESGDAGRSWMPVTDDTHRVYDLFELGGELYGAPLMRNGPDTAGTSGLLRFDGTRFAPTGVDGTTLLPGIPALQWGRMVRATTFRGELVYIVARNTFDWIPVALAATRDLGRIERLALADPAAVPFDLLVRGDTMYALAGAPNADGTWTVEVHETIDAASWRELFRFTAPTFARSFEESGGEFWFGLGCTYEAPSPASGDLLRVRRASWAGHAAG
jgi:hypothetical protein